jgi:hypothetical protein
VLEVRKDAVKALGALQKADNSVQALEHLRARYESALGPRQHGHDAEAGAAAGHRLAVIIAGDRIAALARHAARRMREVPEVAKRLPLHQVEQFAVGERGRAGRFADAGHVSAHHSTRAAASVCELEPI